MKLNLPLTAQTSPGNTAEQVPLALSRVAEVIVVRALREHTILQTLLHLNLSSISSQSAAGCSIRTGNCQLKDVGKRKPLRHLQR